MSKESTLNIRRGAAMLWEVISGTCAEEAEFGHRGATVEEREPGVRPLDDAATGCTLVFVPTGRM